MKNKWEQDFDTKFCYELNLYNPSVDEKVMVLFTNRDQTQEIKNFILQEKQKSFEEGVRYERNSQLTKEQWTIKHDGFLRDENGDVVAKMLEPQKLYKLLRAIKSKAIKQERSRMVEEVRTKIDNAQNRIIGQKPITIAGAKQILFELEKALENNEG